MSKFDRTMRDRVMALAGSGATDKEIAVALDIAKSTLSLWKNKNGITRTGEDLRDFKVNLDDAKSIADDMVVSALLGNALNNNVVAQIFWLKNRKPRQWRDKIEHNDEPIDEVTFEDDNEPQDETSSEEISKEKDEENNPF